MKKLLLITALLVSTSSAYMNLVECRWVNNFSQSGYVGMYRTTSGNYFQFFFGNTYCPYTMDN